MQILRYFSRWFSLLLIIAISIAVTVNYGPGKTSEKTPASGTAGNFRFYGDAAADALIEPGRDPNSLTGINLRKVSWVCNLVSTKAFNQWFASLFQGHGVSLSAWLIQFKSTSLLALHSCLTI